MLRRAWDVAAGIWGSNPALICPYDDSGPSVRLVGCLNARVGCCYHEMLFLPDFLKTAIPTGIGSRSTFWRPVGGRWAELFAPVFMRDLGSSPVAASIKKPRMRSYQTACSVLLGARDIIHVLA